jgi:diguanylate cyclase
MKESVVICCFGGVLMKYLRKLKVISLAVFLTLLLVLLQIIFRNFHDISFLEFYTEGFKIIFILQFIIILSDFKIKRINIGSYLLLVAFSLRFMTILNTPYEFVFSNPVLYNFFLFAGAGFILYGFIDALVVHQSINDRLKYIALYDPLTNLPNRNFLLSSCPINDTLTCNICKKPCELNRSIDQNQRLAILFIDIDDFKLINDYSGHASGDRILKLFAKRLLSIVKERDIVSRISGDEFLIILRENTSLANIEIVSSKIIETINQPFLVRGREINISCSIGVSLYPDHGSDLDALIKKADITMYEAKRLGKNNYLFFHDQLEKNFDAKFISMLELKKAIRNEEFITYYQTKANTIDHTVTGLEALARWKHPTKGIINPNDFIPLAEEIGEMHKIDQIILKQACQQIQTWIIEKKKPYTISINVSPQFFMHRDFLKILDETLEHYHVHPTYISLEITENMALKQYKDTKKILYLLKKRQLKINIDDFGKGYSSFNYIKEFEFDYIKIDKSFIDGILINKVDPTLIETIIRLSHLIGFKVISEGVENAEQLEFLKQVGCHEFQGYILSKPLPIEEFDLRFNH